MNIKCVIVGDCLVGKTCLLQSYTTGNFLENSEPTIFDNYRANVMLAEEQKVILDLFDTSGDAEYDSLRQISYQNADVVLICFSLLSKTSFENAKLKWFKEVHAICGDTPIILVGTQMDKMGSVDQVYDIVDSKEVEIYCNNWSSDRFACNKFNCRLLRSKNKLGKRIEFIKCSALTNENLKEVFDQAIVAGLEWKCRDSEEVSSKKMTKFKRFAAEYLLSKRSKCNGFCNIM